MPSLHNYLWKLRHCKLVRRLRPIRALAMDAKFNEEPKAKRPCLEDEKQSCDQQENGETNTSIVDSILFPAKKEGGPRFAKRRKCILLMAYNGKGYLGMQKNPGVPTIEEDLIEALAKAEAFPEEMKDNLGKLQFQRCARTDKGVSAARQVVSIKMVPDEAIIGRANSHLPDQIRVIALKRVTKSFDSRHNCSARTYEYLMPTYAFAPFRLTNLEYRIDDGTVSKVKDLLGRYVGTHNFHNFTSGSKFEQMASNRFIMSFECGEPFLAHSTCTTCQEKREVEFVTLKVKGQSFMLHQIRKMIGLVIAIVRGRTGEETLARAYEREKVDIPRAPGFGLLLENVHFERYNVRIERDSIHELLDWTPYDAEVEKFKREHIYQSIINSEINEMSMSQWLGSLQIHEFNQTAMRLKEQQQQKQLQQSTPTTSSSSMAAVAMGDTQPEGEGSSSVADNTMAESDDNIEQGVNLTSDNSNQQTGSAQESGVNDIAGPFPAVDDDVPSDCHEPSVAVQSFESSLEESKPSDAIIKQTNEPDKNDIMEQVANENKNCV